MVKVIAIKNLAQEDRPRERLYKNGAEVLSNLELLALILGRGTAGISVLEQAQAILEEFGSLRVLASSSPEQIMKLKGLGLAKTCQLLACFELASRWQLFNVSKLRKIKIISDACCRLPSDPITGRMSGRGKSACGFAILDAVSNNIVVERSKYLGEMSVPQAEYEGLVFALDAASEFCRDQIEVWLDSELVVRQMTGEYCIRSPQVKPLFDQVKVLERRFLQPVRYFHHDRGSFWARHADRLANQEYSRNQAG